MCQLTNYVIMKSVTPCKILLDTHVTEFFRIFFIKPMAKQTIIFIIQTALVNIRISFT